MLDLLLGLLKLALLLFALLLVPLCLIISTPFVMLWPGQTDGMTWRQRVRARYRRVAQASWLVAQVLDAVTM